MPLSPNEIQRIDAPAWAKVSAPKIDADFGEENVAAIQAVRDQLLAVLHYEVTGYLADPELCFDDDTFPSTQTLNGQYYVAREVYLRHADYNAHHVAIMAHCLGESPGPRNPDDYLGLEVHLQWLPETRLFAMWRNTDSSMI